MEVIAVEYFPTYINTGNNDKKSEFHSYKSDDNEKDACDSHAHMVHLFKTYLESGRLVSIMSIVWTYTDGCAKQYMSALDIYLINVLSSSYVIIMDRPINKPGHGNNVVGGLNAAEKRYLKG